MENPGAVQDINLSSFHQLTNVSITNATQLTKLNVKNGSTENDRYLEGCTALTQVCADDNEIADWQTTVNQGGSTAIVTGCNNVQIADVKDGDSKLKIYPNPVKDVLYFKGITKIDKVEIYNMVGQKVKTDNAVEKVIFRNLTFSKLFIFWSVLLIFVTSEHISGCP